MVWYLSYIERDLLFGNLSYLIVGHYLGAAINAINHAIKKYYRIK